MADRLAQAFCSHPTILALAARIAGVDQDRADLKLVFHLLSKEYGWTPDQIGGMTLGQLNAYLSQIYALQSESPDKKPSIRMPDNLDVRDLCHLLAKDGRTRPLIHVAREFTQEQKGFDSKAKSLLRQARRFRHLWDIRES